MQPPGVGRIAADLGGPIEGRPFLGAVVWLALDIRLLAAQFVAERRGGLRPRAAGVFPLRLGRQPKFPFLRQLP